MNHAKLKTMQNLQNRRKLIALSLLLNVFTIYGSYNDYTSPYASSSYGSSSSSASAASTVGKNYIFNMTGKSIILKFSTQSPIYGDQVIDSLTLEPFTPTSPSASSGTSYGASGYNSRSNYGSTSSYGQSLQKSGPQAIDMHFELASQLTIQALVKNSDKIDPIIDSCQIPMGSMAQIPNDFKISLQNDQIVTTQVNSINGVQIPGSTNNDLVQWPSQQDLLAAKNNHDFITHKIQVLSDELNGKNARIIELKAEIKSMHNKNGSIKFGYATKNENRKKMLKETEQLVAMYTQKIAQLQAQLNQSIQSQNQLQTQQAQKAYQQAQLQVQQAQLQAQQAQQALQIYNAPQNEAEYNFSRGGTVAYNPVTGIYSQAQCRNGICPQANMMTTTPGSSQNQNNMPAMQQSMPQSLQNYGAASRYAINSSTNIMSDGI